MPRIKRWAPIAHGFNRDPEVRELRKKYADWMGYVWLEMCMIGDLNGGIVPGTISGIAETNAYISLWARKSLAAKKIIEAIAFMAHKGWIAVRVGDKWLASSGRVKLECVASRRHITINGLLADAPSDCILLVNYLKYHPKENPIRFPPNEHNKHNEHQKKNKKLKAPPSTHITPPDYIDKDTWSEWLAHRKRKHAPLTAEIARRLFIKLEKLQALGHESNEVLRTMIDRNWTGLEIDWIHKGRMRNGKRVTEPKGFAAIHEILEDEDKS